MARVVTLRFKKANKDTFEAIRSGLKSVETRAATARYRELKAGDTLRFACGGDAFMKKAGRVTRFRTIRAMLKRYNIKRIEPFLGSERELRAKYRGYSGYREKIRKFGLVAVEVGRSRVRK